MLKGKQLFVLFLLVAGLAAIVAAVGSRASATPSAGPNDQTILLPLVSAPDILPTLVLEPFAIDLPTSTITAIVNAGDERLFAVGREGRIFIVQPDGTWLTDPFLDIHDDVSTKNWEEGLLGLVFHPQYPTVPFFFISYTNTDHVITIKRFRVDASNPDRADVDSKVTLLDIAKVGNTSNPAYLVHNGGDLHFGPDGYLYSAFGDGGPDPWPQLNAGDPDNSGQRKDILLGNIIRIDVNENGAKKPDCGQGHYSVPSDNPFADGPGGQCDEIWATGFRNPWRFSFDSLTGDLYLGEVGESLREEIDYQPANSAGGENYGWHCYEGSVDYRTVDPDVAPDCPEDTLFTMPIYEYDQSEGDCSVIGGYVYRGQQYTRLYGRYVFADFCTGRMWMLTKTGTNTWTPSPAMATSFHISSFGEDSNGELYVGNYAKSSANDKLSDIRHVTAQ
jgi:glucose/arabinose dehydrogenase